MALSRHPKLWEMMPPVSLGFHPWEGGQIMIPNSILLQVDREIMKSKQGCGQNLGGRITLASHHYKVWGDASPRDLRP